VDVEEPKGAESQQTEHDPIRDGEGTSQWGHPAVLHLRDLSHVHCIGDRLALHRQILGSSLYSPLSR
jgi:hypothetical protein